MNIRSHKNLTFSSLLWTVLCSNCSKLAPVWWWHRNPCKFKLRKKKNSLQTKALKFDFTDEHTTSSENVSLNLLWPRPLWLFPGGARGKEHVCQCRKLDPWVGMIPWRRKWQPTPVFLPGEFHGQRNLAGYNSWGCKGQTQLKRLSTARPL